MKGLLSRVADGLVRWLTRSREGDHRWSYAGPGELFGDARNHMPYGIGRWRCSRCGFVALAYRKPNPSAYVIRERGTAEMRLTCDEEAARSVLES